MRKRLSRLLSVLVVFAAMLAVACGGSDDAPRPASPAATSAGAAASTSQPAATRPPATPTVQPTPTNQQILNFVKLYQRTEWNYLASTASPKDLYDLFVPECQRMVTLESLEKAPGFAQQVNLGLKGMFVQDLIFLETVGVRYDAGNTLLIVLPRLSQTTIVIDGKQQNMFDWLRKMSTFPAQDQAPSFHIIQSGNTLKVASCESLTQWQKA